MNGNSAVDVNVVIPFTRRDAPLARAAASAEGARDSAEGLAGEIRTIDVTVVIPFTRRDALLARAVASAERALERAEGLAGEILTIDDTGRRGVSWARNQGLSRARGEWVVFVDADDALGEGFFTDILEPWQHSEEIDLVVGGFETEGAAAPHAPAQDFSCLSGYAYIEGRLLARDTHVWGKAFRRSALAEGGIAFAEDLTIGEDMLFLLDFALFSGKRRCVAVTEVPGYRYTLNPEGAMGRGYDPSYLDELICWERARDRMLAQAQAFVPYAFSALGAVRVRTALMVPLKLARLPEEAWDTPEVREALARTRRALRDALRQNGAFAVLTAREKGKVLLFLASPRWFLRLAGKCGGGYTGRV